MGLNQTNFRYLNRGGTWPDFHWAGLELRDDGALRLISVPHLEGATPADVAALPSPTAPAGVAVGPDGTVYYTDPEKHCVLRIEGCFRRLENVPCLGRLGDARFQLNAPRGLAIHGRRGALMVADTGNHRVQLFDLDSWQLLDTLGGGRLDQPWGLAVDGEGSTYVADCGISQVVKFSLSGDEAPEFWSHVQASALVTKPAGVAVWRQEVFILDLDSKKIFVFDLAGQPVLDASGSPVAAEWEGFQQPLALAADAAHIWVGDNGLRRVLQFNRKDHAVAFAGEAAGYQGPVAALAPDQKGGLWVAGGGAPAPVRLALGAAFGARGVLWSDRISVNTAKPGWHRFHADVELAGIEPHVQFFLRTSNDPTAPKVDPQANSPFTAPEWTSVAPDVADSFIGGGPRQYLWAGAVLLGDRKSTAAISQMRVEFDHQSYLDYLPEIYRGTAPCADFLLRFLSLFESFFDEGEQLITDLPRLFDPRAAPAAALPWLATWLALDLPDSLDEKGRRGAIAAAFESYSRRGTAQGLRHAVLAAAGVHVVIEEPILNAGWWRLPAQSTSCNAPPSGRTIWQDGADSVLGFTTGLAAAMPQGAVVGATCVLDQSNLITDAELGAPLFESVAHQFSVLAYRGDVERSGKLAAVEAVVENEKPAHTAFHLCVVEPRMRVGFQSRLGIDTVVSGPPSATRLADGGQSAAGLVLAGAPAGVLGVSRVGEDTRL